jgi:ATP-dependent protease ClpP protease subunit
MAPKSAFLDMTTQFKITASSNPAEQVPGIFALSKITADDGAAVGVVDIVDTIGQNADENIRFADKIAELISAGCKKLRVRVNSPGGCVFTALSIYDTIQAAREKGVFVQSEVMGLAASAASFVILAADRVIMSPNSQIMIHEPSTVLYGKLSELKEGVELTERVWAKMVDIYTERTGSNPADFVAAHTSDVYYTAEQALAAKLVDEIGSDLGSLSNVAKAEEQPKGEPAGFAATARKIAARLGLLPSPAEKSAEEKLTAALDETKKISAELEGMRAQLATAIEERAAAQQERDAALADRSADIERGVAARLAEIGQPVAELPPSSEPPPQPEQTPAPVLEADAKVLQWLAGGAIGTAVSYACQSTEHRAQVQRLRSTLKK